MRRILLAALVAAVATTATPANAAPAQYAGGCRFGQFEPGPQLDGDQRTGTLYFVVALYDPADPTDNPVSADVSCELVVDGSVAASTSPQRVTVAGAGGSNVWFEAGFEATLELCTVVANRSDGSADTRDCIGPPEPIRIPPDGVLDPVNDAIAEHVDPPVCAAFASLAPGVPGVLDVDEGGDVYVAGEWFWDCAPYGGVAS